MSAACHPLPVADVATVTLTPKVASLLAIAAAHDRMTPENFIAAAICRRVEEIGIASAVEWMETSS